MKERKRIHRVFIMTILIASTLLVSNQSIAQEVKFNTQMSFLKSSYTSPTFDDSFYTKELPSSKIIFMRLPNAYFNQTFLVHKSGNVISSSFSNAQYFRPNYNAVVFGAGTASQDSFNPYGSNDMGSALVSGTINKLIGIFSKNR